MDKETIKKSLVLCSFEGFPDNEMGCEVSDRCPYYKKGCITGLTDDAYLLINEMEEMQRNEHQVCANCSHDPAIPVNKDNKI